MATILVDYENTFASNGLKGVDVLSPDDTLALDYLEKNGYLTCETKSAKRYKSPMILTDKGIEVGKTISDKIDGILDEISVDLTEEERTAFYRSLSIISERLEAVSQRDI